MSEFHNPYEVIGIRPELIAGIDPDALAKLSRAATLALQAIHHPDRGGKADLSARINLASSDLDEGSMLPAIRQEYLDGNPFTDRVQEMHRRIRWGGQLWAQHGERFAEIVATGAGNHFMDLPPCRVEVIQVERLLEAMTRIATEIRDSESRRDLERESAVEAEYTKRLAVTDDEVNALINDPHALLSFVDQELRGWLTPAHWVKRKFTERHPALVNAMKGVAKDSLDRWLLTDPQGIEFTRIEGELHLEYVTLPSTRRYLRSKVQKHLEEKKKRAADHDFGELVARQESEDEAGHLFIDSLSAASLPARGALVNEALARDFEAHRALKAKGGDRLEVSSDGTLRLIERGGAVTNLEGVTIIGLLRTAAPSAESPSPWNASVLFADPHDRGVDPKATKKADLILDGTRLRSVSPAALELALGGRGNEKTPIFTSSFNVMVDWIREIEEGFADRVHRDSLHLMALVTLPDGRRNYEVLGEVIAVEAL